jgi:predicted AlkP superfamily pyrophosphatase or phosphodiesterase
MWLVRPRGLLLGCILAALGVGCGEAATSRGRVLLVGIDGATLRVARPLLKSNRLPNLARIAGEGVYGPLRSHAPLTSPRIWTSIATGKNPRNHGVLGFALEDSDGEQRLYQSFDRTAHALWNIASEAGLRVAVVNWWTTYPLEPVNGVMVSDHLLAREIQGRRNLTGAKAVSGGPIVYPESWEDRVQQLTQAEAPLTSIADPFLDRGTFPEWARPEDLSERYEDDEWITRIALAVEADVHPDLLMVFLPGIDRVSHRLWGALEPETSPSPFTPDQRVAAAEAVRRYYEYTDALVGALLARYDREDLVLVVSDHGFEAGSSMIFLTGEHKSAKALNGVIFARGAGVAQAADRRPISVNDITPTILAWWGLPVGRDMDGVPASFLGLPPEAVASVATYDGKPVERIGDGPSGAEEALFEQLRSLGYLEQDDSP